MTIPKVFLMTEVSAATYIKAQDKMHSSLVKWGSQGLFHLRCWWGKSWDRRCMNLEAYFFFIPPFIPTLSVFWKTIFPYLFLNISVCTMHYAVITEAHSLLNWSMSILQQWRYILLYYTFMHVKVLLSTITGMSLISGHSADMTWKNISGHTNNNTVKKIIFDSKNRYPGAE